MRALVSAAAVFLFAGSLASFASAQDTVGSKKFRINFRVDETTDKVLPVELWVTRDGGRNWIPSGKTGVTVEWGVYSKGRISARITVPDDGSYGFYAQFKDGISNEGPTPSVGTPPDALVKVDSSTVPLWIFPREGSTLQCGEKIVLRWSCSSESFRPDSVKIELEWVGIKIPIETGLPLEGEHTYPVPPSRTDLSARLHLTATDRRGKPRTTIVSLNLRKVSPQKIGKIEWLSPKTGTVLESGREVAFNWRCTAEAYQRNSVTFAWRTAEGAWEEIATNLSLRRDYNWRIPEDLKQIEFRLSAKDRRGEIDDSQIKFQVRKPVIVVTERPQWIVPGSGMKKVAGSTINLQWTCSPESYVRDSVSLYYWVGGEREAIRPGLPLSGSLAWTVPPPLGRLRLQLQAVDRTGKEKNEYTYLLVVPPQPAKVEKKPEWIQPKSGSYLISGQHIILQWKVPPDLFQPLTVEIDVSYDGVEFINLERDRPLNGTYQWRIPPHARDRRMWLRLTAKNRLGNPEQVISKVTVRWIPPVAKPHPKWIFPKSGDEFKAGALINLQWIGSVRDFKPNSVSIDYSYDGSSRTSVSGSGSVTGDQSFRIPKQEGNLTFYLRAKDRFGIERESKVHVTIREARIRTIARPEWVQPTKGDELIADVLTPLRWRTMGGDYQENSVTLEYSVDGGKWRPIIGGRRLTGTHLWRAPREAGGRVSLRLKAKRTDGSTQVPTDTEPFTLSRKKREELIVRWIQPGEGESVPADSKVVLRWSCPKEGYQPDTVTLSVSKDGGDSWKQIEQKRPLVGEYVWQVTASAGSDLNIRASVLETNGRERENIVNVKVIQSMAIRPEWLQPGIGDEVPAGAAKILRWHTPKEGFLQDSVSIFASVDGGPEDLVGKHLKLSGSLWYQIPDEEGGRLRLRLVAQTKKGRMVPAILEELRIKTSAQKLLSWIHPRESAVWKGGETVQLQWTSLRGDLREKSAHLYYSVDGGRWILVTRGLEPAAFYLWTVPWRNGAQLKLKVTARTRGGTEVEAVSHMITVEATSRPDIAMAKRHADRARIYAAQNRTAQASQEYEKALAIWSDYPEALNDLGAVYSREKQYAKALEFFLRAKKAAPSSPFAYVNAASMEIQLGLSGDALEDLRDAIELGVDRNHHLALQASERLWQLAKLYQISGEAERSEEACGLILRIRLADRRLRRKAEAALTGAGGR